jgi:hypothetical protein
MNFDETYTDKEFEHAFNAANADLFASAGVRDPDLDVPGLGGSIVSRLLALLSGDSRHRG